MDGAVDSERGILRLLEGQGMMERKVVRKIVVMSTGSWEQLVHLLRW